MSNRRRPKPSDESLRESVRAWSILNGCRCDLSDDRLRILKRGRSTSRGEMVGGHDEGCPLRGVGWKALPVEDWTP